MEINSVLLRCKFTFEFCICGGRTPTKFLKLEMSLYGILPSRCKNPANDRKRCDFLRNFLCCKICILFRHTSLADK
mgnify:CR=1 FL=1